jgi:hypothetical protein
MGGSESKPGYRILEVLPKSPVYEAKLQPFLDFILAVNGTELMQSEMPFQDLIRANEGCPITLTVYSILTRQERECLIVPQKGWGGDEILGIAVRYEDANLAASRVLHVTGVSVNSPSSEAGLIPNEDYILGATDYSIENAEELATLALYQSELKLVVYNKASKEVRHVGLKPDLKWGGSGALGCEIAEGYMHTLLEESN